MNYIVKCLYIFILVQFFSCIEEKNFLRPKTNKNDEGYFFKTNDGTDIFIFEYKSKENYNSTIFIISGITGINHNSEKDIIELLSNNENRVVVIHPRGTGFSEGTRGDINKMSLFINDYKQIIVNDKDYITKHHPIYLYGHSMSSAVLLAVADSLENICGAILINPPYLQKIAKGMSPSIGQYIKYACYMIFAKHKPIVNMAGNPSKICNESDKKESLQRMNDSLLVKYFSMFYMNESKKLINSMIKYTKIANYKLLLIYGLKDNIVDKKGCDMIFETWKSKNKTYITIENGSHGKSTVMYAKKIINEWIKN